ncbi:inner membrane protein YhjD [Nocardioides koreensis]|uniref:Inner membrane protein YhjD n=1 Tax=Nocardioides koreensis TaxID=433651 RepID=A0ABP5KQY6_9ACTN
MRTRRPLVDHAVRMQEHYGAVKASQQAGAVTYFAFLSIFPILALSFFVVGWIARVYPGAKADLRHAINGLLPHLVGPDDGQIKIQDIQSAAAAVGLIGLATLVYSGLGWLSAMRDALIVVFELPSREQPSFVLGKLRDLLTLTLIGFVLLVSVAVAGLVGGFSQELLTWAELDSQLGWLVQVLTLLLGFAANVVLFFSMFVLLAEPHTPRRSLWSGAMLGAVAFEVLKQLSNRLFAATQGSPAFQAFGIALILLVWINYFSRVVLYAAAWAHTSPAAREQRLAESAAPVQGPQTPALSVGDGAGSARPAWVAPFVAGGATALAAVAVVRSRLSKEDP